MAAAVAVVVLVAGVFSLSLHREGLFALPGQTIIVLFPAEKDQEQVLALVADAGATLAGYTGHAGMLRLMVIDPAAPRRLAQHGLVFRDPLESLGHCFGWTSNTGDGLRH